MQREFRDSREAFSQEEEIAHQCPPGWECIEGDDYEPSDDDLAELEAHWPDDDYYYDDATECQYEFEPYDDYHADHYDGESWEQF